MVVEDLNLDDWWVSTLWPQPLRLPVPESRGSGILVPVPPPLLRATWHGSTERGFWDGITEKKSVKIALTVQKIRGKVILKCIHAKVNLQILSRNTNSDFDSQSFSHPNWHQGWIINLWLKVWNLNRIGPWDLYLLNHTLPISNMSYAIIGLHEMNERKGQFSL